MEIVAYKKGEAIEEKYFEGFIEKQIKCWGSKPFEEYKICTNVDCMSIYSIEESLQLNSICGECQSDTKEIHSTDELTDIMKQYTVKDVSSILVLDRDEQVQGFGMLSKGTIKSVAENEFNTRPSSYISEDIILKMSEVLYNSENAEDKNIICFHQIYLSSEIRNSSNSYTLLKSLFELHRDEYKDIPVVGETRYDCKFYPISRSIGFQDIVSDKHGYII